MKIPMNANEIDVTALITNPRFLPWNLSNSRANLGDNAGTMTWNASKAVSEALPVHPLDTPERLEAWREFATDSGGWTREEVDAMPELDLRALFTQWVAGDIRECFGDDLPDDPAEWDWSEYEQDSQAGRIPSRLFLPSDKRLFFYIGN